MTQDEKTGEYRFIKRTGAKAKIAEVKEIAAYILDHYTGMQRSPSQYVKMGQVPVSWREKGVQKKALVRFEDILSHIQGDRTFDADRFGLPISPNNWLDSGVGIAKPDAPICASDKSSYLPFQVPLSFGPDFPVRPCIDREGVAFSSFQGIIQANIVRLHKTLIDNCATAIDLNGLSWFHALRMLLNECVSIVDITLHQLYFKAEYGPRPAGWTFDPDKLGPRHGVRLTNKLKWINKITGKPLDDARAEVTSFVKLKDIRNHFSHFDPPCVAFTMADVAGWLNLVADVGRLLWKMRARMAAPLSKGIVEMIALPVVEFVPQDSSASRLPQGPDVGYTSSTWSGAAISEAARDPDKCGSQTYDVQEARSDRIIVRILS